MESELDWLETKERVGEKQEATDLNGPARVRWIIRTEEEEASRESAYYWLGIVVLSTVATALILYCHGAFKQTLVQFQGRGAASGFMSEEAPSHNSMGNMDRSPMEGSTSAFAASLWNYPENGISLIRIGRVSGTVAVATTLVFGIFFQITDYRYRKHLKNLEELGLKLPDSASVETITARYLSESANSPVYEKIVLEVLACAGPAAVSPISEFMFGKLDRFNRLRDHSAMIFVVRCARILTRIGEPDGCAALRTVQDREDEIRQAFLESCHNMVERVERKEWLNSCFREIRRLDPTANGKGMDGGVTRIE